MATKKEPKRVLARTKARTLSQDELDLVAGGGWKTGSKPTETCYYSGGYRYCYTQPDAAGVEYDFPF